ncbi:MAG: cbb3-type cytochrome c oxidase subunit I [Deltaproteobacteria bacterium]|nr:cbb3-type cytochrome c oxidase subunit I [Deltaproteobacteria bacterium]
MFGVINNLLPNEPGSASRRFFLTSAIWLAVGVFVALLAALELIAPDLLPADPRLTFGRLRPTHINIVVFGFLLSGFFGGFLYVVPQVCKTELFSERLANFAVWFWNLIVIGIAFALPHGFTQGREYAEAPWILDVAILAAVAVLVILVFGTIIKRTEKLLYVSVWYIAGGLLWTFFVYATGNVVWEPSTGSWLGMNDQILLWFYGHNVVGLVITPQAVALAYYILPRATKGPLYSHTLSLIGFWALIVMYTHVGTHHLIQAPVPQWLKVLSIVNSIALVIPVFAFLTNVWLTVRGRLDVLFEDPGAKFVFAGTVWYLITCLQGPFHSLPAVQEITHFTQWVVAHAHLALLGFAGSIAIGAAYFIVPKVTGRKLYSPRLADYHFWLTLIGGIGIFVSLTIAGLIQGEGWRNGEVVYRLLSSLRRYFVVRGICGVMILTGSVMFIYNILQTILRRPPADEERPS